MSMVMNFAFLVKMVLLRRNFTVVMSAVGVLMLPLYSNLSPPTHSLTLSESDLDGLCVQTMVIYVTFFFVGTFDCGIKKNVLVLFTGMAMFLEFSVKNVSIFSRVVLC